VVLPMTLNLMLINPSGIWQCSDMRLTDPKTGKLVEDHSVKHVLLRCGDGAALIMYSGIGSVRDVPLSDWIRQILRGEPRTLDQSLIYLRERATEDLGPIVKGEYHHRFTIGSFLHGRPWFVQIINHDRMVAGHPGPPQQEFGTVAVEVGESGCRCVLGDAGAVRPVDLQTLKRVASRQPREPKEFRNLLAAINRRAAERSKLKLISPHCITTYVPPAGHPGEGEIHGVGDEHEPVIIPTLLFGIDLTDLVRQRVNSLLSRGDGISDEEMERVLRASVVPQNPLKKP